MCLTVCLCVCGWVDALGSIQVTPSQSHIPLPYIGNGARRSNYCRPWCSFNGTSSLSPSLSLFLFFSPSVFFICLSFFKNVVLESSLSLTLSLSPHCFFLSPSLLNDPFTFLFPSQFLASGLVCVRIHRFFTCKVCILIFKIQKFLYINAYFLAVITYRQDSEERGKGDCKGFGQIFNLRLSHQIHLRPLSLAYSFPISFIVLNSFWM